VRQVHRKEVDLALDPGDLRQRFAKIHLRMARIGPAAAFIRTQRFVGDRANASCRRVSPIAADPGEGPLSERIAGVRPVQREPVFMPLKRPSRSSLTGPADVSLSEPRADVQPAAAATVQPTPRSRPSWLIRMRPSQIP
jgi:hypothetical protein